MLRAVQRLGTTFRLIAFDLATGNAAWDARFALSCRPTNAWNQLGYEFIGGTLFFHGMHDNHFQRVLL